MSKSKQRPVGSARSTGATDSFDPIHRSNIDRSLDLSIVARMPARWIAVAAAVLPVLVAATLSSTGPAGAQGDGSGTDERIVAVQFDLEPVATSDADPLTAAGSEFEAHYRSVVVGRDGDEVRLQPLPGSVEVGVTGDDATAMTAEVNGLRIGHASTEFGDALADAVSSGSAHRFARLGADGAGSPVSIDVSYGRPLTTADHLLVQEGAGDGAIELVALDGGGAPVGATVRLGPGSSEPSYQWNTGHGPVGEASAWASVVGIGRFQTDKPVDGIRVSGSGAEVKVLALTAGSSTGPDGPVPPTPAADPVGEDQPVTPVVSPAPADADQARSELVESAARPVVVVETPNETAPAVQPAEPPARSNATASAPHPAAAAPGSTVSDGTGPGTDAPGGTPPGSIPPESTPQRSTPSGSTDAPAAHGSITRLAMTGNLTEPWVLVIFAMGLIFIGYTVYAAFRDQPVDREPRGHDQLDSLGFD